MLLLKNNKYKLIANGLLSTANVCFVFRNISNASIISVSDDFCKFLELQNDVKENDDFKNAKIYKISKEINDVIYIGLYW